MRCFVIAWLVFTSAAVSAEPPSAGEEHVQYWVRTVGSNPLQRVRMNAARMLGTLGERSAVPALVAALQDTYFGVRAEAARALGLLTDENAMDALMQTATDDPDPQVRRNAREAIEKIKAYQEYLRKKQEKLLR
jgi:HEAT repeat protein